MNGVVVQESSERDGGVEMPGILPRSEGTSGALIGHKMAVDVPPSAPVCGHSNENKTEEPTDDKALTNGDHKRINGTRTNGISTVTIGVQRKAPSAIEPFVRQLPPEIEHITYGYTPFSMLISRLVQETCVHLGEAITIMSEVPTLPYEQSPPLAQMNQPTNRTRDASGGNVRKRLRILNFASDRRAQFIKLLILSGWTRQAKAISTVIDLNVWLGWRLHEYKESISWVGELKRILLPLKDPNPDIETALEVLSLGKASWLPDLGYLPPERHSPQRLLSTLCRINNLLSIRLNLHEDIPPAFREFSIASGRATFRVPEEFEVDLSIAEEDPSSQLYFIDFRFLFSPMPADFPTGGLRDLIENGANDMLSREGLKGLLNFLHNLTLTHKLRVLRDQAYSLARGYRSEQLKVEAVHRSLVVQYWIHQPGGKNWIEIGIKRGKASAAQPFPRAQELPSIALRWFRSAKEVVGFHIDTRLGDLSLANLLSRVIALHTSFVFEQIVANLRESCLYSGGSLRVTFSPSAVDPMDASLLVQLTTSRAVKVVQEPVSGRFSILPASQLITRAEYELNRLNSPAKDGASQLAHLRSFASLEQVDIGACLVGWEPVRSLNPDQETMQRLFTKKVWHNRFFKRRSWGQRWILAFTSDLNGDAWWITELTGSEALANSANPNLLAGTMIQSAYKIVVPGFDFHVMEPSPANLAVIENTAAGMISQFVDTRALSSHDARHIVRMETNRKARFRQGSIFIRFPDKITPFLARPTSNTSPSRLEGIVRLSYFGLDTSKSRVIHTAYLHMQQPFAELQGLLSTIPLITFEPASQTFPETVKLHFHTQVGDNTVTELQSRLKAIGLLLEFASTIRAHRLKCNAVSLTRLMFYYSASPAPLTATIHFPKDAPRRLFLSHLNPHLRIDDYLTECIRSKGIAPVLGILRTTLPILRAFLVIEASSDSVGVNILARSDQWYQIRYSNPYPRGGFDVRLRTRRDDVMWLIPEASIKRPDGMNEAFKEGLTTMLRGKGEGWRGVNGGMIAYMRGVEDLIVRVHDIFQSNGHLNGNVISVLNLRKRKAKEDIVEID